MNQKANIRVFIVVVIGLMACKTLAPAGSSTPTAPLGPTHTLAPPTTTPAVPTDTYMPPIVTPTTEAPTITPNATSSGLLLGPFEGELILFLPENLSIEEIFPGREGLLWIRTAGAPEQSETWMFDPPSNSVMPVDAPGKLLGVGREGQPWVLDSAADAKFVSTWDDERWQPVFSLAESGIGQPDPTEASMSIAFLAPQNSEALWVGQCVWIGPGPLVDQGGVRWWEGQMWFGDDAPPNDGCVTKMAEDDRGGIWVGVNETLWHYDPVEESWDSFSPPLPPNGAPRFGFFTLLQPAPDGSVWAALSICGGASCFAGEVLFQFVGGTWNKIGDVYFDEIGALFFDETDDVWVIQSGKLFRVKDDLLTEMATFHGNAVSVDELGRVWLVADQGDGPALYRLDPKKD